MALDKYYKLIPLSEITDESREIAKRWYEGVSELDDIREKHKLASDIQNYARRYHESQPSLTIQQGFDIWDAAQDVGINISEGRVTTSFPDKAAYFASIGFENIDKLK